MDAHPSRFESFEFKGSFEAFAVVAERPFAVVDEFRGVGEESFGVGVLGW